MSQSTSSSVAPSTPVTTLEECRLYQQATAEQRTALLAELDTLGEDELEHHLAELEEYPGTVEQYLAALAVEMDRQAAERVQGTVVTEQPATPTPGSTEPAADTAAEALAAKLEQQAAAKEAEEAAYATKLEGLVKSMVKHYRQGEREYRMGLIQSGRDAAEVVGMRLAVGATRKSATQLCEGRLAMYSSDTVDVNRLIRCWAAYHLLCEGQGLVKAAANVPYGYYRDAWCLVVERVPTEDGEEYRLLPGVEELAKQHFSRCVADSLGKEECIGWAKVVQREALQVQAKAAAEEAARQKAEREQAEARQRQALEATRAAAALKQQAEDDAQQARAEAEELARAAAEEQDPVAKAKAQEEAVLAEAAARHAEEQRLAAKAEADARAKQEQEARFALEQKARDEARARQEAADAIKRQSEAEAKRAEQERKAKERADRKAGNSSDAAPATVKQPTESRQGQNLLLSSRNATPKDAASMAADVVRGNSDPMAVLYEAVATLLDSPPKDMTADDVVRTLFLALGHAKLEGQTGKAVQAARLVLTRKPDADKVPVQPAAEQPATVKQPAVA